MKKILCALLLSVTAAAVDEDLYRITAKAAVSGWAKKKGRSCERPFSMDGKLI